MAFDFGRANEAQRSAIETVDGPVLITAGPGTGKTFTLVQRVIYLIEKCGVAPEEIMVATFTEKAAKELVTRITNELDARGISVNLTEMHVGTFHSLCLRILKENLEYTRLKQGFRVLDEFDQSYTIFQNFHHFKTINGWEQVLGVPQTGTWRRSTMLCSLVNNLCEELVEPAALLSDSDPDAVAIGQLAMKYRELLAEENLLDFASIQVETHRLLTEHPEVADKLSSQLRYLMIDEYQDTNYVQEQLVFLLAARHGNICVVGDDDQGLYRFRGATIRNILEFPSKFSDGECKIIPLVTNYRSDAQIVEFYNEWMSTTSSSEFRFDWAGFRYDKTIKPASPTPLPSPSVIRLEGQDEEDWQAQVLRFIEQLKASGKLTDYNQLAFLFRSVKHSKVKALAKHLEQHGINVYSPRSEMFFERDEIKLSIGLLLLVFPAYVQSLSHKDSPAAKFLKPEQRTYYFECINQVKTHLATAEGQELREWLVEHGREHMALTGQTDYAIAGLFYQMLAFEPFVSFLATPMDTGMVDLRPTRNLALLTQIIGKFEYLHNVSILSGRKGKGQSQRHIDRTIDQFFTLYLRLLMEGGIGEYEDDSEYAPSGYVSFLTIHQSKGMEFPIVFTDSLHTVPRKDKETIIDQVIAKYSHREAFEPEDQIKFYDFWRVYYTAFSRAQNLLVLTCARDGKRTPSKYFRHIYNDLPEASSEAVDLSEFTFETVKDVNIKAKYSFTSHISVYETCPRQYKFYRDLEFSPVRVSARLFGTLVHQTIEDVHRAALRGEEHLITAENVTKWFDVNYTYLSRVERTYLAPAQQKSALGQVQRYVARQDGKWERIKQAEVDVSLVKPEYIVGGTIDLIRGEGGTVEIVDFKSEKKPDLYSTSKWHRDRIERYRRQLHLYAHLVHERTGETVSKMHVYYTGEEDSNPQLSWDYSPTAVEATMEVFDETVHKIRAREYSGCARSEKACGTCDFNAYCSTQPGKPRN